MAKEFWNLKYLVVPQKAKNQSSPLQHFQQVGAKDEPHPRVVFLTKHVTKESKNTHFSNPPGYQDFLSPHYGKEHP